jgi:hypothetical protein
MILYADYVPGDPPEPTSANWEWVKTNYPSGSTSKSIHTTVTVNGADFPVSDTDHQNDSPGYVEHGSVSNPWTDSSGIPHILTAGQILYVSIEATFYPSLESLTMTGECEL